MSPRTMHMRGLGFLRVACVCAAVTVIATSRAGAQQVPPPVAGDVQQTAPAPLGISPRGALIRAMLVPGWGHAAIGSYTRGGFYFALEAATAYTFVRTQIRLSEARERADLRETVVLTRLAADGVTDRAEIEARIEADDPLQGLRNLVESREGQREDLIAWSIFLVFLSGADAYVSAHLAGFPTPIEMDAAATSDGRAEVMLRVPLP